MKALSFVPIISFFVCLKILSEALIKCHKTSSEAGTPLQLQVFISGRNRLENPGAKSLAAAFEVRGVFIATGLATTRLSPHTSQLTHHGGAYSGFFSVKRLGVFLLHPGWDASLPQGYPQY